MEDINMAAVLVFRDINMAVVTSRVNTQLVETCPGWHLIRCTQNYISVMKCPLTFLVSPHFRLFQVFWLAKYILTILKLNSHEWLGDKKKKLFVVNCSRCPHTFAKQVISCL